MVCHRVQKHFASPYLDWELGGDASFKAMPFRTGPTGSPPSCQAETCDESGGASEQVNCGTEPAETHSGACNPEIIVGKSIIFTLPKAG